MNIKGVIKNLLKEENNFRNIINKIVRRIDLDGSIEWSTKWSLNHYKSRFKDISPADFVELVVYNSYIDDISPIFEDWSSDEGFDGPKITITEKDEDKILGLLKRQYSQYIINIFEKEKEKLKESFILEDDTYEKKIIFFQKLVDKVLKELSGYCEEGEFPDWVDFNICEELEILNKMKIVDIKKTDVSDFKFLVVNEVSFIFQYYTFDELYHTLQTRIKQIAGIKVVFEEEEQINTHKREW